MLKKAFAVLFLVSLTGCGTLAGPAPSPAPGPEPEPARRPAVPHPASPAMRPDFEPRVVTIPRPESSPLDPILDSPWASVREMQEEVLYWMESLQNREADLFRESLRRMGRYREMVARELAVRHLPPSLLYLPIVESWYNPRAVSWVGAGGLWQFMAPTARGLGLRVNRLLDERRDPYRATPLALDFLAGLHQEFGSWFLALAAYNGGPGRVSRVLRRREGSERGHDGLFLEIRPDLPRETRNFVPRFLAAAIIARDPDRYGFGDVMEDTPPEFDVVAVPDATSLDVVARAAGVGQDAVEALNPQLLRGLTPAGVVTRVRVPAGKGPAFASAFARIPEEERVTFVEHRVVVGETLTHIARAYGVTVDDLRGANPRVQPRRLQIGQRIVVPKAPSARLASRAGGGSARTPVPMESILYRVRSGDTLSAIAARHRVRVGDLLRWNGLTLESVIHPGDQVKILVGGGAP